MYFSLFPLGATERIIRPPLLKLKKSFLKLLMWCLPWGIRHDSSLGWCGPQVFWTCRRTVLPSPSFVHLASHRWSTWGSKGNLIVFGIQREWEMHSKGWALPADHVGKIRKGVVGREDQAIAFFLTQNALVTSEINSVYRRHEEILGLTISR